VIRTCDELLRDEQGILGLRMERLFEIDLETAARYIIDCSITRKVELEVGLLECLNNRQERTTARNSEIRCGCCNVTRDLDQPRSNHSVLSVNRRFSATAREPEAIGGLSSRVVFSQLLSA
jgi:hypothetical protein